MKIDQENDCLHGVGLYTLFVAETFDGGEPPVWFSQQVRETLRVTAATAAPTPRLN
jgi:hypothetical protein